MLLAARYLRVRTPLPFHVDATHTTVACGSRGDRDGRCSFIRVRCEGCAFERLVPSVQGKGGVPQLWRATHEARFIMRCLAMFSEYRERELVARWSFAPVENVDRVP